MFKINVKYSQNAQFSLLKSLIYLDYYTFHIYTKIASAYIIAYKISCHKVFNLYLQILTTGPRILLTQS